jgi:hypothetical protein
MPAETPDYATLVAEAEKAVAAVKDPDLRRAAFEKVLEKLLDSPLPQSTPRKVQRPHAKESAAPARARGTSGGPTAYVEDLINDSFFKKPQNIAAVKTELANRGHHIALTSLSGPLQKLCQRKLLRRNKAVAGDTKKGSFVYSNW